MGIRKAMNSARIIKNHVPKRSTLSPEHALSLDGLLRGTRESRGAGERPLPAFLP